MNIFMEIVVEDVVLGRKYSVVWQFVKNHQNGMKVDKLVLFRQSCDSNNGIQFSAKMQVSAKIRDRFHNLDPSVV